MADLASRPCARAHAAAYARQSSGSLSTWMGWTPYEKASPWHTAASALTAAIQTAGLNRESILAVEPVRVGTNTASHGTVSSACSTTVAVASAVVAGRCVR